MLEQIDFTLPKLTKAEYKPVKDKLIEDLIGLQQEAHNAEVGLVVLVEGWNGAGKGSRISDLLYHLDARATSVSVTADIDRNEVEYFEGLGQGVSGFYPDMQEFWKALGPRGTITFFDRGWYTKVIQRTLFTYFGKDFGKTKTKVGKKKIAKVERAMRGQLQSIESFEQVLTNNGYTVLKLFLHISEEEQASRLKDLYEHKSTRWRVNKEKLLRAKNYQQAYRLYDDLLERSDFDFAPWSLINAEDKRRANLEITAVLAGALASALEKNEQQAASQLLLSPRAGAAGSNAKSSAAANAAANAEPQAAARSVSNPEKKPAPNIVVPSVPLVSRYSQGTAHPSLDGVDHQLALEYDEYRERLKFEQQRLHDLELEMFLQRVPLMIMFEGWDAAGKGGAIKRVAQSLDARAYTIFPSPAPSHFEKMHPHLWRYWTRLPKAGHVGIYDRSWYGRVLVERVEEITPPEDWARAYDEINAFEEDLREWGAILIKFWVDVSQEEQLKRFEERASNPLKQWKITEDDWRNREKYPQYYSAIEDMFRLTSTPQAPWTILESENKYYARVKALQIINDALSERLH